jgi:hypothetical protein
VFYQTNDILGLPVVGDFNGDGIPDIAVVGLSGIWLFLGAGGGVFNPGVLTPVPNAFAKFFYAADFNGDGNLDVVTQVSGGFAGDRGCQRRRAHGHWHWRRGNHRLLVYQ